jgi:hypothetical protein
MYCDRPLVEYNVSDGAARQINTTDYSATSSGRVAAAVWPWKCKNAVFQYNEVFDTLNTTNGNGDGQAWDADYGDGTLYQYNYSHNNSGGCVMFCGSQAYQTTFRYNISQNDLSGAMDIAQNPDAHVYNNVFYMKEGVPFIRDRGSGYYGNMVVENNIIYYAGDTARTETWNISGTQTYSNNLYYNYANVPESDTSAVVVSAGTQVFALAGSAPTESSGIAYSHTDATVRSVFDGYKLCAGSPAIGKGKTITDYSCVDSSTVDFFGNELKAGETPDIGANQYQADQETVPAAPQKVEASTATSDSVVLSWNAVQDLVGIAGYRIMNGDTVLANVTDGSTSVELTGLTPGTTYTLNVVAYDVNGAESAGQTIVFSTAAKEGSSEEKPSETEKSETPSTGSQTEKNPQTATLTLNQTNVTLYTKGTKTVTLKTSGVSGNVTWTSSNTKVATVKNGVVTAKKAGTTVITATVGSSKAVCNVTVKKASLKVSKKKLTLKKGKKASLKVKAVPAGKVTYKSSNKKVAKVTSKGVVKAVKAGTCKITITCNGMKKTVKVKVK